LLLRMDTEFVFQVSSFQFSDKPGSFYSENLKLKTDIISVFHPCSICG